MLSQRPAARIVADWSSKRVKCVPVPLNSVTIDGFLGRRVAANKASVLAGMASPIPQGFLARVRGEELPPVAQRLAADSDLYKWLEGASYVYAHTRDSQIKSAIDSLAAAILQCQQPDGYINTQVPPRQRFDTSIYHDLYIAGHFFEAAVAHHRATGEERLLRAAQRWADYLLAEYQRGNPYFAQVGQREHSEYEIGLLRLFRETSDEKYLEFALTLARMCQVGPDLAHTRAGGGLHAVRVLYLLTSYAELYMETGSADLYAHLEALWDEIVRTRMYVTGGLGCLEHIPPRPYVLPLSIDYHPDRDIAETCASIAFMMYSWRLFAITGASRYFDMLEHVLYNHFLGALSLDHMGIFYYNPMRLVGDQTNRTDHQGPRTSRTTLPRIHSCSCCIPNAWRCMGALPEYLFAADEQGIYVNLYTTAAVFHRLPDGTEIQMATDTDYPHDGAIRIRIAGNAPAAFRLRLRIPGWCDEAAVYLNGEVVTPTRVDGYAELHRTWISGDVVLLQLAMPARPLWPDPRIPDCAGAVAFQRGPIVYCLEQVDVSHPVELLRVLRDPDGSFPIEENWEPDLLGGINVLSLPGCVCHPGTALYSAQPARTEPVQIKLIPYYARANRAENNRWTVYLPVM